MVGSFIDKSGRKWSPEERAASYEKTQEAIRGGIIKSPIEGDATAVNKNRASSTITITIIATRSNFSNPYVSGATRCYMQSGIHPQNATIITRLLQPEHSGLQCIKRIFTFCGGIMALLTQDMVQNFVRLVVPNRPWSQSTGS